MNNQLVGLTRYVKQIVTVFALLFLGIFSVPQVMAEGSAQIGLNQRLLDFDASQGGTGTNDPVYAIDADSASLFVDIVTVGEVINISLCGVTNTDDLSIEIFDPSGSSVFTSTLTDSNVDCANPMTSDLTNPERFTTTTATGTGNYRLVLQNTSGSAFANSFFTRYDISVTPDAATNPDPTAADGRLFAFSWNFNAGSFGEVDAADTNYYALIPGGRPNTNYVWLLDLNNFAGFGYNIVANSLGVDAPNSGFSTPTAGNAATYEYPVYVGVPAIADPQPTSAPLVTDVRFVDVAGIDNGISPGGTVSIQDTGVFEFTSDVVGTYAIFVDVDRDGVYGNAGDTLLLGETVLGLNTVAYDGTDANGVFLPSETYNAQINVRTGEYHFIANDAETSGGPAEDGLTIFQSDLSGNQTPTQIFWDDVTIIGAAAGGTSNVPDGELSGTPAGSHTWGDFSATGFGNVRFIDTYVYGLTTTAIASVTILPDDPLLTGDDGVVTITPFSDPGDSLLITVTDADLNVLAGVAETVLVTVVNDVTGEVEQVTLTETGVNTGIFTSNLTTSLGAAGGNNSGVMNTQAGDALTVQS